MVLSSAISNLVPIVGGIIAFDESLPPDTTIAALRIAVFTLTILASVLVAGTKITHDHNSSPRSVACSAAFLKLGQRLQELQESADALFGLIHINLMAGAFDHRHSGIRDGSADCELVV